MPLLFGVMDSSGDAPPITSGLVGYYTPDTFSTSASTWYDNSGNGNHATLSGSGHSLTTTTAGTFGSSKSFRAVTGDRNSKILWPTAILPSTYTMFYLARYNTSNSTTAGTLLNFKDGSSTTGAVSGFNGTTSVNGEIRIPYPSNYANDAIWLGEYTFIDQASPAITTNSNYLITIEARGGDTRTANGSNLYFQEWDSSTYAYQYQERQVMRLDRTIMNHKMGTGSSFALGNRWIRGFYNWPAVQASDVYAFWRNNYLYRLPQEDVHMIFSGEDRSWFSGFWAGNAGAAYHGNTLTTTNLHSNNWVLGTDQNAGGNGTLFRTNKVDRYNSSLPSFSGTTNARLAVNTSPAAGSNYQISDVLVYNRTLNSTEYQAVENYLSTKYGV
jgi:hypothetical protein